MFMMIPKPAITRRQKAAALAVAGTADLLQVVVFPLFGEGFLSPFEDGLDFIVALILIAICGFKWQFILAFLLELVPVFDLLPTWTAVVALLPTAEAGGNVTVNANVWRPAHPPIQIDAVVIPPVKQAPTASSH